MKKLRPLFIILLIAVAMANFHIRQTDEYDFPMQTTEATIQSGDTQSVSNSKILTHVYAYMRVSFSAVPEPSMKLMAILCMLVLSLHRIKSHIEYCGKKMVRAIMLQFHPRQQPSCIVPAGALFFCTKKLHGGRPAPCSNPKEKYKKRVITMRTHSIPHLYF